MSDTTAGGLWVMDTDTSVREILNDERTRAYQAAHPRWGGRGASGCLCNVLNFHPLTGAALSYGATPGSGASTAPWYSAALPDSAQFLGFMTQDIIGLDYSNVQRTVNQRSGNGANLTPLRLAGREITFTLIATALSETGMRFGLDWLARQLADIGGRCGTGRALMRLYCPVDDDVDDGRVEVRELALRSGPEWTSNYLEGAGCLVREVVFTLIAGDPCFYTGKTTCSTSGAVDLPIIDLQDAICTDGVPVEALLCGPIDPGALPLDPTSPCCEIAPNASLDTRVASVTIQMVSGTSGPFLVEAWHGAEGADCDDVVANPANFIGRVGVGVLSGTQGVLVDAAQQVLWSRPNSLAEWEPDDSLLQFPTGETPFFPAWNGADSLFVVVRPYYVCSDTGTFTVKIESESVFACIVR